MTTTCRYAFATMLWLLFLADCRLFDHRPDVPAAPVGPEYGLTDSTYSFVTTAFDPDGDSVQLQMSWGEAPESEWSARVAGSTKTSWNKDWKCPGSYEVRVRARDTRGAVSDWSPALEVQIVRPGSLPFAPLTPVGPDSARVGFIYDFACVLRGPPGESLGLRLDWGDGPMADSWDVSGLSGETLQFQQAFWNPGARFVRAQVCDIQRRVFSGWSGWHRAKVANPSGSGWERDYGGGEIRSVAPAADGGLAMTGDFDSGLLATTDAAGNLKWMRSYDTVAPLGMSVRQVTGGGYIIVSTDWGPFAFVGADLVRTDNDGNLLWRKLYLSGANGEGGGMYACAVRPCADGGYIIAASTVLMKTDSCGDSVWARLLNAQDVEPLSDGGYIVCGGMGSLSLTRTDSLGNVQWERAYRRLRSGAGAVRLTPDGGYIVTGGIGSDPFGDSLYLAKTTSDGELVWERTCYGHCGADGWDVGLTSDGGYFVAGMTYGFGSPYLARFDGDGQMKWQRELSPKFGYVCSVLPTPDDGCFVAGMDSDYDGNYYAALFKVDQDGGMAPEFRQPAPRLGPRVAHDLARMRMRKSGLRKEN